MDQLWPRAKQPLGFHVGECWAHILRDPKKYSPASVEAAKHLYQNGGPGGRPMFVRMMVKTRELVEQGPALEKAYAAIERAIGAGCDVEIVLDWFDTTSNRQGYHASTFLLDDDKWAPACEGLIRRFRPAKLEICNEFWYTKGNNDMSMKQYAEIVHLCARGFVRANAHTKLVASIKLDRRDSQHDLWMWYVPYGNCIEAQHDFILDQQNTEPNNAEELAIYLEARAYATRGKAVGHVFPLEINETTFNGQPTDLNSAEGADMVEVSLRHYMKYKLPAVFLAMEGHAPFGGAGGWGLKVAFVDDKGNLSRGVRRWLKVVGGDAWLGPGDTPDPEPDPDPEPPKPRRTAGIKKLMAGQEHLTRAIKRWGKDGGPIQAQYAVDDIEIAIKRNEGAE